MVGAECRGRTQPLELKAGQISLHSDWLLHGSEANASGRRRCGFAARFLSPDVKAFNGWNAHSIVCRGLDPSGHWANHPRPEGEAIPVKAAGDDGRNNDVPGFRDASANKGPRL